MKRKVLLTALGIWFILSAVVIAEPPGRKHYVNLYLSNGKIINGKMIEMKFDGSPDKRVVVIWNKSNGYQSYYTFDIEAITNDYPRHKVEKDLNNKLKWTSKQDYTVVVDKRSRKSLKILKGRVVGYDNRKGYYTIQRNPKLFFREMGAIYFCDSNHAHFTNKRNPYAQEPSLTRSSDSGGNSNYNNKSGMQRNPDLTINYPARVNFKKIMKVNRGSRYRILVENVADNTYGKSNVVVRRKNSRVGKMRAVKSAHSDGTLFYGFIEPALARVQAMPPKSQQFAIPIDGEITVNDYGALYFALNNAHPSSNKSNYVIKIWKLN